MQKIFLNKINFKLFPSSKPKYNPILFFDKEEDLYKNKGFLYLDKNIQGYIKKIFKKIEKFEFYHLVLAEKSIFFAKLDEKILSSSKNFSIFVRKLFKFLHNSREENFSLSFEDLHNDLHYFELFVINFVISNFNFAEVYKNIDNKDKNEIKNIEIFVNKKYLSDYKNRLKKAIIIGEEINRARYLSNLPGGDLTPSIFVDVSKEIAKELDLKIKILEEKDLEKIKAGGLLGVSKGSKEKPFLVILENKNKGKEISLIGKGITFDTGGLHIKIADAMNEMHLDVSGAASVLASTLVIKKLNIPVNLVTFIPLAENMISGESYRPGDILKTISGKTIEVGSPDAEGRIILADAIDYSKKFYKPNLIITLATLTGAAMVALGTKAAAIFSNNRDLERFFLETSEKTFDSLWPLPLWEDYKKDIEAPFADIWNIGKTRWGGAIHGAMFLYEFAKPNNFVHIDMAPRMTATEDDVLNKGSLGFGVYLFEKIFENYKDLYDLI